VGRAEWRRPNFVASSIDGWGRWSQRAGFGQPCGDRYGSRVVPVTLIQMARWPQHVWTSIFTYGTVFVLFPLLCLLAYAWVKGWVF
jgi:hypothetical protein